MRRDACERRLGGADEQETLSLRGGNADNLSKQLDRLYTLEEGALACDMASTHACP